MTQSAPIDAEPYRPAPVRATRARVSRVRQSGRGTETNAENGATAGVEGLGAYRTVLQNGGHMTRDEQCRMELADWIAKEGA